jgi:hypothetical protein
MPWQGRASALLNEIDPRTGRRRNPFVVVTIQRQAGKTSWLLAECVDRALFDGPRRRVWYTAQNGQYARDQWAELADQLMDDASPFAGRLSIMRRNGAECLTFPNGSTFRPFPPTRDALHSKQSDLVIVDEAWRHDAERGAALLQGIGPTQATRPGAQVVVVSTAGALDTSTFLKPLVDRGRGGDPALAYLEYSVADDVDPFDLDAIVAAHPAVGWTIDRSFLEREAGVLADMPGEYVRAYGNRWTKTLERAIDGNLWQAAATPRPLPAGRVVLAADVAQDQTRGAIVACNGGVLEVVESRPGTAWVAGRVRELVARWDPAAVLVDRAGPSSTVADDLTNPERDPDTRRRPDPVDLFPMTTSTYAAACARFMDDLTNRRILYRAAPALDAAVDAAATRKVGDGWVWARRSAAGPICELVAATLASWGDRHRPAAPVTPDVSAG